MLTPEGKLARGATAGLTQRGGVGYYITGAAALATTLTSRMRHLMVTQTGAHTCAVTLPPVMECAGQVFSIVCDARGSSTVTIADAGDDPDFTTITLNAADEFAVVMSNGVRWLTLVSVDAVL